jgi:hypothetical protein
MLFDTYSPSEVTCRRKKLPSPSKRSMIILFVECSTLVKIQNDGYFSATVFNSALEFNFGLGVRAPCTEPVQVLTHDDSSQCSKSFKNRYR